MPLSLPCSCLPCLDVRCVRVYRVRVLCAIGLGMVMLVGSGTRAWAQSTPADDGSVRGELVWKEAPLDEVLSAYVAASGVEIVYAMRLVRDVRVTGHAHPDDSPERVLEQLLRGTDLRAERIRPGQFVLIKEPVTVEVLGDDPTLYTGTLESRVVDAESGAPLRGAHVWLVDVALGGVADAEGYVAVPNLPAGDYVARVSHVGYRPVRLELSVYPISPRLPMEIRLQPKASILADAQVTPRPLPASPVPGSTDLGARQAAAIPHPLAENDLAGTLDWLPGVGRAGGTAGAFVVRGADPTQTFTLRDGVPLYAPWHAFGLFSAFQPEALARVRFHRGSLPADLTGGLAAVLEVETRNGMQGEPVGRAALGPTTGRLVTQVPLTRDLGVHVAARRSTLGGLIRPELRSEPGWLVISPLGKTGWSGERRPSIIFGDLEAKMTARLGSSARVDVNAYYGADRVRHLTPGDHLTDDDLAFDYAWQARALSTHALGMAGRSTLAEGLVYRSEHRTSEIPLGMEAERRQDLTETGIRIKAEHFVSLGMQMRAGGRMLARAVNGTILGAEAEDSGGMQRQRTTEAGIFGDVTWKPADGWEVQPGLRVDAYTAPEVVVLSPRLHARWIGREDRVVLRVGAGRQAQSVHRLRATGPYEPATARWLLADERTPIAQSWHAGAGAEWAPRADLAFSIDTYGRWARNLVRASTQEGVVAVDPGGLRAEAVTEHGRAIGLEVAGRYSWEPWLTGFSYAWAASRRRLNAEDAPSDSSFWQPSPYDRTHTAGLLAERRGKHFALVLRLDAESGVPMPGGRRTPAELRMSASIGTTFSAVGLQWEVLLQGNARSRVGSVTPASDGGPSASLVADLRSRPVLPLLYLSASW